MTATKRRVDRLERSTKMKSSRAPVIILATCAGRNDEAVAGIKAAGERLPAMARLPGETVEAMKARAATMASGSGPLIAFASYSEAV